MQDSLDSATAIEAVQLQSKYYLYRLVCTTVGWVEPLQTGQYYLNVSSNTKNLAVPLFVRHYYYQFGLTISLGITTKI